HRFALLPKTPVEIFVIIFDASIVTKVDTLPVGTAASVYVEGTVKFFSVQLFRKNPMVFSIGGSTGVTVPTPPPAFPFPPVLLPSFDFLQLTATNRIKLQIVTILFIGQLYYA